MKLRLTADVIAVLLDAMNIARNWEALISLHSELHYVTQTDKVVSRVGFRVWPVGLCLHT